MFTSVYINFQCDCVLHQKLFGKMFWKPFRKFDETNSTVICFQADLVNFLICCEVQRNFSFQYAQQKLRKIASQINTADWRLTKLG